MRASGRKVEMAPEGLSYRASWVTGDLTTCFQVMECDARQLLEEWSFGSCANTLDGPAWQRHRSRVKGMLTG